jgi:hypothetical protein
MGKDDISRRLDERPELVGRFLDVLMAYAVLGQPGRARAYMPEPLYGAVVPLLYGGMETFVLGHEYGHIIDGHLEHSPPTEYLFAADSVEALQYSWTDEFAAGRIGIELATDAFHHWYPGGLMMFAVGGAALFFDAMEVMCRQDSRVE